MDSDVILRQTVQKKQNGVLRDWEYFSTFERTTLHLDSVNTDIGVPFLREAHRIIDNILDKVNTIESEGEKVSAMEVTRLQILDVFLRGSLLSKVTAFVN